MLIHSLNASTADVGAIKASMKRNTDVVSSVHMQLECSTRCGIVFGRYLLVS